MLDLKFIRENPQQVREAIESKGTALDLDKLLQADQKVRDLKKKIQLFQEEKNANAKKVPCTPPAQRAALIEKGRQIGTEIECLKPEVEKAESELQNFLWLVPNIPAADVPKGKSAEDNVEVRRYGAPRLFGFEPKNHIQLLNLNNWVEFDRIAKVAGSRSYALKNDAVLLEFSLLRFAMDYLNSKGFVLISVPSHVREFALYGTGHFPTGRDQVYHLADDDLYLSGTAEVPITSLHSNELLQESELPMLYGGFSPCFRREAGSAGKDVRGLIRVHQFMKVEQFVICKNDPEESKRWHNELLLISSQIVEALDLPYRVIECCTGDMGAGKVKMFDIECWTPSESAYRETHSCSSLHDWQARRANLRYRDVDGVVKYCHTLNNTAIATPRLLAVFLENHQREDGSISIPLVLQPYLMGRGIIGKSHR